MIDRRCLRRLRAGCVPKKKSRYVAILERGGVTRFSVVHSTSHRSYCGAIASIGSMSLRAESMNSVDLLCARSICIRTMPP